MTSRPRQSRRLSLLLAAALVTMLVPTMRSDAGAVGICGGATQSSGTITGIVNTYFPGNGTAAAGATSITIGAANAAGATTAIAVNDMLMVIQMQDAAINASNSSSYGAGTGSGAGSTSDQTSGVYEYVTATNAITSTGGTLTIKGTGTGNGLLHAYHTAAGTATQGTQTFQVIRVPSYSTLTANITGTGTAAAPWNGKSGGVFAVDVAGAMSITGTINVDGDGFRGGGVQKLEGSGATEPAAPQVKNADFATTSASTYHGDKGEGTVGTPFAVVNAGAVVTGTDTMPGGSFARGAPGNAGGGGSDEDPAKNDQNTGGGGGAGAGAGGQGGNNWSPSSSGSAADNAGTENPAEGIFQTGGFGGVPVAGLGVTRWTLGGGGGAGANNDGTNSPLGSSGGNGGGVVMIRAASVTGGGAVSASGTTGTAPLNDGGGGGGGGGTIFVTATGTITATASALGAAGTSANLSNNGGGSQDHGPGGGGGGGMVVSTGGVTATVTAGTNGTTTTAAVPYGAQPGSNGTSVTTTTTQIPGVSSAAECAGGSVVFSIGPAGNDAATGSYDGSVPATNDNDFTAINMQPKNSTIATNADGTGVAMTLQFTAANSPCIAHTFQVHSGGAAKYTFIVTPPAGADAGLYSDSACTALYGGATVGTTSTGTSPATIASGAPLTLYVQYTTPVSAAVPTFTRIDALITAEVNGTTTPTNTTHDELYVGYLPVVKTVQSISPVCAGGEACPGSTVTYALAYSSVIAGANSEQTLSPVPFPVAQSFTLIDDGTTTNNWATNSNGLTAAPTAVSGTTFTYYTGNPAGSTGSSTFATNSDTKFAALIGGTGYKIFPPGVTNIATGASSGTLTFAVKLK